jgi:hypothetical protein
MRFMMLSFLTICDVMYTIALPDISEIGHTTVSDIAISIAAYSSQIMNVGLLPIPLNL